MLIIDGKALLLKNERAEWGLPGGRIELGETPKNCLIREFQEETSVNVKIKKILDRFLFEVIFGKHVFIVNYGCELRVNFLPEISYKYQ